MKFIKIIELENFGSSIFVTRPSALIRKIFCMRILIMLYYIIIIIILLLYYTKTKDEVIAP